jgi:hypothetical protein
MNKLNDINFKINENAISKLAPNGEIFIVMIDDDDFYFKIDGIAAKIWQEMETVNSEIKQSKQIYEQCLSKFNIKNEQFTTDFNQYLNDLIENNIIQTT